MELLKQDDIYITYLLRYINVTSIDIHMCMHIYIYIMYISAFLQIDRRKDAFIQICG